MKYRTMRLGKGGQLSAVRDAVARAIGQPAYDGEITLRPATAHQSNRLYDVRVQGQHAIAKE